MRRRKRLRTLWTKGNLLKNTILSNCILKFKLKRSFWTRLKRMLYFKGKKFTALSSILTMNTRPWFLSFQAIDLKLDPHLTRLLLIMCIKRCKVRKLLRLWSRSTNWSRMVSFPRQLENWWLRPSQSSSKTWLSTKKFMSGPKQFWWARIKETSMSSMQPMIYSVKNSRSDRYSSM